VVDFLLGDTDFPRSVGYCLADTASSIKHLPHHSPALRAAQRVKRRALNASASALLVSEQLHEFIDGIQEDLSVVHNKICQIWFSS
jgi:uncharacterized alpha-E superfamily protein